MKHSLWRDRKTQKRYVKDRKAQPSTSKCPFCSFTSTHHEVARESENFWVTTNSYPYATWDGMFLDEHFMLVPKRHVVSIGSFNDAERDEFSRIIGEYEQNGYSIYGRAAENAAKSVAHQHTHLLKVSGRQVNTLLFSNKFKFTLFR